MPPHLKKSIHQAHLENGTYEKIVSHLEKELELNGLEAPDELQINSVTQQVPQQNSEKPKPTCRHCKKPGNYRNQHRQIKRGKDPAQKNKDSADKNNNNSGQANCNSNKKISNNTYAKNTINQKNRRPRPVYLPRETYVKTSHSTEKCYFGANAANRPHHHYRRPEGQNKVQITGECPNCSPHFRLETPRLHSGAACDRPEKIEIPKLPPIPEVVSQQPLKTSTNQCDLNKTNTDSAIYCTQKASKTTVARQTSPPNEVQPHYYVVQTEQPPGNQTGNAPVPFVNCSKNCPTDIQN